MFKQEINKLFFFKIINKDMKQTMKRKNDLRINHDLSTVDQESKYVCTLSETTQQ